MFAPSEHLCCSLALTCTVLPVMILCVLDYQARRLELHLFARKTYVNP